MINLDDVIKKVRELARKRGDVTYLPKDIHGGGTQCSYAEGKCSDGTEGCIFGQAFKELGTPISPDMANHLGAINNILSDDELIEYPNATRKYLKIRKNSITKVKLAWCAAVQGWQDKSFSWKEAVIRANNEVKL